jgi:L-galactose dehydrogenase
MKFNTLGKTKLKVSRLAFGGSSLGSMFKEIDDQEGVRAVQVAIDLGINLFDTAPYYGATKAETMLGRALQTVPREQYLLATKVGRYVSTTGDFDFSADRVTASVDESLRRLRVETIDFIQVHDIEFGNLNQIIHETIPALRRVQAAGKVRFVGITGLPVNLYRQVMEQVDVDQIQSYCHFCLNDTALLEALPYLQKKNVAIFNAAPIAMRLLTDDGPPAWHPAPAVLKQKCAEAARFCREHGADLAKLALQFSVSNPAIPTTIVGTASPKRIRNYIREIDEPLDQDLLRGVQQILAPVHNLTWPSGLPENNPASNLCLPTT